MAHKILLHFCLLLTILGDPGSAQHSAADSGDTTSPSEVIRHQEAPSATMPTVYYNSSGDRVRWIAASSDLQMLTSPGEESGIGDPFAEQLRSQLTRNGDDCHIQFESYRELHLPGDVYGETGAPGLPRTLRNAGYAFFGSITGSEPGFSFNALETLYRVQVDEVLKGPSSVGREYFFFLPAADFQVAEKRYCAYIPGYPAELPETGDSVLIIKRRAPISDELPLSGQRDLVVFKQGHVFLSDFYSREHGPWRQSLPEFKDWIRAMTVAAGP
jgi:hypothetical protein